MTDQVTAGDVMVALAHRVIWQRQGGTRPKVRRYVRRARAEGMLAFLTSDPHARCEGHETFCVWDRGSGAPKAPPPWLIEPRMEVREVGAWRCDADARAMLAGTPTPEWAPAMASLDAPEGDARVTRRLTPPRLLPFPTLATIQDAIHAACVERWRELAERDPDLAITMHLADAHQETAERVLAALEGR